jgi:DNA-binding MarR family transcriptional regulator
MIEKNEREARITMNVLAALERGKVHSQRDLARELGIALGLTNAYVKKCVQRGYIIPTDTIGAAMTRTSPYALTPKGYLEKNRLTARFLRSSLTLYTEARTACRDQIQAALQNGYDGFIFTGRGILSEIALLTLLEFDHIRTAVYVDDGSTEAFLQQPVVHDLSRIGKTDVVMFTEINHPLDVYRSIRAQLPTDRILVPHLLRNAVSAAQKEFEAA